MNIYSEDNYIVIENVFYDGRKDGRLLVPYNALALDVLDDEILIKSAENGDVLCAVNAENLYLDGVLADMSTLYEDFDSIAYRASAGPEPVPQLNYFKINNLTDNSGSVTIRNTGSPDPIVLKTSTDGQHWETTEITSTSGFELPASGYILFNGKTNETFSKDANNYWQINANVNHSVSGDIATLLVDDATLGSYAFNSLFRDDTRLIDASTFDLSFDTMSDGCYSYMFSGCSSLVNVPELPATTLTYECYKNMFNGCTSLTTAPTLPSTSLQQYCYRSMFSGCTSLTTAPALPATTLQPYCYQSMFNGCTSLTTAPALPATTLQPYCYQSMFNGCTSLTTAPALPATTLANNCYELMFRGCTSLTTAPALPATTLADGCYNSMFNGCTSLTTAPDLPATKFYYFYSCYASMFQGCSSLTTAPALPATTLQPYCYQSMFRGCTSLTSAPALPATTLADSCYREMFSRCTSLTAPPALPATTLQAHCYREMFLGCTGLTTAPALPATTLETQCYQSMFERCSSLTAAPELAAPTVDSGSYQFMFMDCSSLNNIKCLATDISQTAALNQWVLRVSATGTFECAGGMSATWPTGISGIPTGWTVVDPSVSQTVSFTNSGTATMPTA